MGKLTSADFAAMLQEDLSPSHRDAFERDYRRALDREALHARIGEEARRRTVVRNWQNETLKQAFLILALQFVVEAWEARKRLMPQLDTYRGKLTRTQAGMQRRLARARKEAAGGDTLQQEYLAEHAELFAAIESRWTNTPG